MRRRIWQAATPDMTSRWCRQRRMFCVYKHLLYSKVDMTSKSIECATDMYEILTSNLLLLGFHPSDVEEKHNIRFNRELFEVPNRKAFNVIIHLILSRLDAGKANETFRDCWPVYDKKQEQVFTRACQLWINDIRTKETQLRLPTINASALLSPCGKKIYIVLIILSTFTLSKLLKPDRCKLPVLTPSNRAMKKSIENALMADTCLHQENFLKNQYTLQDRQKELKDFASKRGIMLAKREEITAAAKHLEADISTFVSADDEMPTVSLANSPNEYLSTYENIINQEAARTTSFANGVITLQKYFGVLRPHFNLDVQSLASQQPNVNGMKQGIDEINYLSLIQQLNQALKLYSLQLKRVDLASMTDQLSPLESLLDVHHQQLKNVHSARFGMRNDLTNMKSSIQTCCNQLDGHGVYSDDGSISMKQLGHEGLTQPTPIDKLFMANSSET
ncbi:PREDICTED: HAUS augmin-like complex subunit 6 isoform X2 [Priapulus caudatus]|uniref:HAUS augmin-like complex subunit 6 isoform X2 n=1 Tax=Priapulus caudatus TaxID=37621 RepID=A0ABM1ESL3_PRICU|nr:PREDICTED: HAUS augmin-like complex subunit 6 isoform X2 [Priapulus caudatus]